MPDYPIKENTKPINSDIPIQSSSVNSYVPSQLSHSDPVKRSIDDFFPATNRENELPLTLTSKQLQSNRFPVYDPSLGENEFAGAQGWGEKMVNGVGKGLGLMGTTFLQSTVGMLNGVGQAFNDGRFASFYDNEFNRGLDKFSKEMEDKLPNYYTDAEREAHWYAPSKLFSANFFWDGIIKNLGFSAGAALSGGVYGMGIKGVTSFLSQFPKLAKLVSVGKAAEALAATETSLLGAEKIAETAGKIKKASDSFLNTYNTLNIAQRVTVAGLATTGEAGFEALNNMNQFRDEKIAEYKEKNNGNPPIGMDLQKINQEAEAVGNYSLGWNIALLSATNYIQFPKILGSSYKAEKGVINDVIRETKELVQEGGEFVVKPSRGGKFLGAVNKVRPYVFSTSEGFEEGAQYAITVGTQDYFDKKLQGKDNDVIGSIVEGISKTLTTDEGMENVLIGGLSGAMMLGVGKFKESGRISRNTADALKTFNQSKLSDFTKETLDSVNRGVVIQEEREQALKEGRITESKDLEKDYIINYLVPRIKYGRFDLVMSDIEDYKKLASTEEGWTQLVAEGKAQATDSREAYLKRLGNLEQTANNMKSAYQALHIRYGGITDEKGIAKYSSDVIDKMVYASTKIFDYDERINSLIPVLSHPELLIAGVDVSTIISDLSKGNYESFKEASKKIDALKDTNKEDLKEALNSIKKMVPIREKFHQEYEEMKISPEKWTEKKEKILTPEEIEKLETTSSEAEESFIELDTIKGKKKTTVGRTYFLGSVVDYDKNGLEKPIEIPEFKIVKDNGDTIDILTSKGELKTISKDSFKNYILGDLDTIKSDDNANFFYHHRNEKFEFNFGKDKDGKPRTKEGRIEYKDGKLFFVYPKYTDRKTGKVTLAHMEVSREQFFSKGEFKQPMIKKIGAVETTAQKEARERLTDEKKRKDDNKNIEESTKKRNTLLTELLTDLTKQTTDIKSKIEKAKARLKNISDDVEVLNKKIESEDALDKRAKNEIRFKKSVRKYITAANSLLNEKQQIEDTINTLEQQEESIELSIAYIKDIQQYPYELSPDIEEFTKEIEDQISLLEETKKENHNQISILKNFLVGLEKTIDKIFEALRSLVSEFEEKYPKVPDAIIGKEWVDFLQLNPNFLKSKPNYKEDLKTLEDVIAETEEFDITPKEKYAQAIKDEVDSLEKELKELDLQTTVLNTILDKFKPYAEQAKQQRIEEETLAESGEAAKSVEGTMTSKAGIRNADLNRHDKDYEPEKKKDDERVVKSTITTNDGKPHQKRSNLFGAKLNKFKNKDNIRGVYITSENEKHLIPGLIDFLLPKIEGETAEERKKRVDDVIAFVMVEQNPDTGELSLVGVDGKALKEGDDPLEKGIFQVFPEAKLRWSEEYGGESMFRKTTPEEVQKSLREQYAAWRNDILERAKAVKEKDDLLNVMEETVKASFGIPDYVMNGEEIDYDATTSVEDAQLITDVEMKNHIVLDIPTTNNEIENGPVKYTNALGRVFIKFGNILVKLQNRKINNKEAETLYKVIHRLSKLSMVKGGMESEEAKRLFTYVRSVVYYRVSKDEKIEYLGRNNVFIKKDPKTKELKLYIADDKSFTFKPTALETNKNSIIESLEGLFMNTNSNMIKQLGESYEEITDVKEDGTVVSNSWDNYQTYLLSKNNYNGSTRKADEIPLFTYMKPIVSDEETNRHGIYFYTDNVGKEFVFPEYSSTGKKSVKFTKKEAVPEEELEEDYTPEEEVKPTRSEEESAKLALKKVKEKIATEIVAQQKSKKSSKKVADDEFSVEEIENYVLDFSHKTKKGTANVFTTKQGTKIVFFATSDVTMDNYMTSILISKDDEGLKSVIQLYIADDKKGTTVKTESKKVEKKEVEEESITVEELEKEEEIDIEDLPKTTGTEITVERIEKARSKTRGIKGSLRERKNGQQATSQEDWNNVESWLKKTFPHIPLYRVKNILVATNGRQAWGMFKDGALYIYQNAEVGTIYHEVFHGIWNMVSTPEERVKILDEFRKRSGTFYDVKSEKNIKYSEATMKQAEEKMAEEFRDYVHEKKIPVKPKDGRPFILKLFSDIVNVVKAFFTGEKSKSAVEELFSNINSGTYKSFIPYESSLNFVNRGTIDIENEVADGDFSLVKLSDRQKNDVIEHMTWLVLRRFIENDESLFNIPDIKKGKIYPELKQSIVDQLEELRDFNALDFENGDITDVEFKQEDERLNRTIEIINDTWIGIVDSHQEYLKKYGIEFDENDNITLNSDENTGKDDFQDARKIDNFRKANSAIKILLATIPKAQLNSEGEVEAITTSIGGVSLIPASQTTISLWNKLAKSVNIDDMMSNLREMAKTDVNYRALYSRLMKTNYDSKDGHKFENIDNTHGAQLINAFWNTFKKQNPSVQNIFVLDNGEIVVGPANLSSASMQFRDMYEKNIVQKARSNKTGGFFKLNKKTKRFIGNADALKDKNGKPISLIGPQAIVSFLGKLGIEFTVRELDYLKRKHTSTYNEFEKAVNGIKMSVLNADEIVTFGGKALDIKGNLLKLGIAKSVATNPQFDSTFFNIVGERMQSYIGPNAASNLFDFLSNIKNKEELRGTQYEYLLDDSFSQGSNIMKEKFDSDGDARPTGKDLLEVGYAGGILYTKKGKSKESSKLTYMERLIQELNLNLKGWYLNLIPGDASIEWMINMGIPISTSSLRKGMGDVHRIFGEYFISEFNLMKDNRKNLASKRLEKNKNLAGEMRFFKEIIGNHSTSLYNFIISYEGEGIDIYNAKMGDKLIKDEINKAIDKYVKERTDKTERVLTNLGVLTEDEAGFTLKDVALAPHMQRDALTNELTALTINYMIANIEMHKLIYSDPYQYSDELKRIKSFLSPRQSIISGSLAMNTVLNNVWNKGFRKKEIGHTDFIRDYFRTITLSDIKAIINLPGYKPYEETDGSGIISFKAYRNFRIRVGNWNDNEERQFRYDIAWEKKHKNLSISQQEQNILDKGNPKIQSAYTPLKPIVAGNKANDRNYNDIVLDKYALYPLSYRMMMDINTNGGKENSNAILLYDKMQKEDIDYAVFNSGRKVGAEQLIEVYDKNGKFVTTKYKGIINIPFAIMSLQTEVPSKEGGTTTRGSQATKLITMDFMEAGVPIDFLPDEKFEERYAKWHKFTLDEKLENSELFKEIQNNQNILEALMADGYSTLLHKLGIKEVTNKDGEKEYQFSDFKKAVDTLKDEILKREVNDNLMSALNSFENETSLLESTPAYQQVRNILYSIVDKLIVSPKMPGGQKVQIPVSLFEQKKLGITPTEKGNGYQSDELKFYSKSEDGKKINVCEVMLPRWFKSDLNDVDLLNYLNTTDEGKRILRGIGFRIPTQKQNSIDVFVIKQFLPQEFGDSVVIPSALVQKAGSDFDIDKLSIYLKNVITKNGKPELVEYLNDENSTVEFRYGVYIKSKVDDYNELKRESKENSIEGKALKTLIQNAFEEYKRILGKVKKANITDYQEELNRIKETIESNEFNTDTVYQQGYSIFKELPKSLQQVFYTANDELEKRIKSGELKSFEKTIQFKILAIHYLNILKEDETYTFEYQKKDGKTADDTFDGAEVINVLNRLNANYDLFLSMRGWTKEVSDDFYAKLNQLIENKEEFKDIKETIKNKKLVSPRAAFYQEFDNLLHSTMADVFGLPSLEEFGKLSMDRQNIREALENAYIESSDALISHPLNYNQLIKPNSAKQLKDLSARIAKAIHGQTFDYESIDNMLDRTFMSRLRHAFVSGKQAIAIAAVSQTNHSLNQRQPMYIDPSLLKRCTPEDLIWLKDGKIKFAKFNKVRVGDKMLPTLSKIKNAAGDYISDIIAQFIDGYVDISKGPWIMEMGASPNVAPTFLFLIKLGVPVDTVAYFMNQPLIRNYLKELESNGYVWLFNDKIVEKTKLEFATSEQVAKAEASMKDFQIPSEGILKDLVGKKTKFTEQETVEQLKMLDEFLKYAKMATHLLSVTQATNYDTATFNDPLLIWKKEQQMIKAKKTLISSAEELLNNSFIGKLPGVLNSAREAIAKILISDQDKVRKILQKVLLPYIDMSDNDFLKVAKKATADIFDYAVQTNGGYNKLIEELFDEGAVDKIAEFINDTKDPSHPLHDNHVVNILQIIPSEKGTPNSVNNVKIRGTENKIYDQNNIIYAFREIRDVLGKDSEVYKALINIAILQSGLSPSTISYTSLIPFEDFSEVYNKTLSKLEKINLEPFATLGIFYKNNWNNDDIVSRLSAFWIPTKKGKMYNISMKFFNNQAVQNAIEDGSIPPLMTVPLGNKESNNEYVFYTWNLMDELLTEKDLEDVGTNNYKRFKRIFEIQDEMRKKGDYSYMKKALFKKVLQKNGAPLMTEYKEKSYVVYKAVNALGDGNKANEFYTEDKASIIDNGLESVNFVEDSDIEYLFEQPNVKKSKKRADGYMSPQADYDTYNDQSPIAKMIESSEVNKVLKKKEEESKKCNK